MKRRDFLLFRTGAASSVAELSCERLFMHYQQASTVRGGGDRLLESDAWDEESTSVQCGSVDRLFGKLTRELADADEVRVCGAAWLADARFAHYVRGVLDTFRRQGGRVTFGDSTDSGD